jgi:acetamidase/formamidase
VRGARPGDVLIVEILDVKPAADFGWTAIRPGGASCRKPNSPSRS